jgi:hypothetical protein
MRLVSWGRIQAGALRAGRGFWLAALVAPGRVAGDVRLDAEALGRRDKGALSALASENACPAASQRKRCTIRSGLAPGAPSSIRK